METPEYKAKVIESTTKECQEYERHTHCAGTLNR